MLPTTTTNDHDLLVRLDTKLDLLSVSFNEVKLAVASKADVSRVEKLETSVDAIKAKVFMGTGALAALEFVLRMVWK